MRGFFLIHPPPVCSLPPTSLAFLNPLKFPHLWKGKETHSACFAGLLPAAFHYKCATHFQKHCYQEFV